MLLLCGTFANTKPITPYFVYLLAPSSYLIHVEPIDDAKLTPSHPPRGLLFPIACRDPKKQPQYLAEDPGETDIQQALEENKGALENKRHRVKALRIAIADLRAYHPHLADTATSRAARVGGGGDGGSGGVHAGTAPRRSGSGGD